MRPTRNAAVGQRGRARVGQLLLAVLLLVATPSPLRAQSREFEQVDLFLAAVTRGDVDGALDRLDDRAVYEGLLVCSPTPCVGRPAIAVALAREADDWTAFDLWTETADEPGHGRVTADGAMRCHPLAPARIAFTLDAQVGSAGIVVLRLKPDQGDPRTARIVSDLASAQALFDEARAFGPPGGPLTLGGRAPMTDVLSGRCLDHRAASRRSSAAPGRLSWEAVE